MVKEKYISPEGQKFLQISKDLLDKIEREQAQNIDKAAEAIANAIAEDRLIHLLGAGGHTWMPVMEFFYRAGGLACVNPLFDLGITVYNQAWHGCLLERLPGYGKSIIEYYSNFFKKGDVIVITSNIPYMMVVVEAALECKKRGLTVIGIGSKEWQEKAPKEIPSRHPSGQSLVEISDIFIDDYNPYGDAVIEIKGSEQPVGSTSNIADCYIVQRIVMEVVKKLIAKGVEPPIYRSANLPGGDEYNKKLLQKYLLRVKWL
jgi:uncharacterized phosphosugar-binding protein